MDRFADLMFRNRELLPIYAIALGGIVFMFFVLMELTRERKRMRLRGRAVVTRLASPTAHPEVIARQPYALRPLQHKKRYEGTESQDVTNTRKISAMENERPRQQWKWMLSLLLFLTISHLSVGQTTNSTPPQTTTDDIQQLKSLVNQLQSRVAQLEGQQNKQVPPVTNAVATTTSSQAVAAAPPTITEEDRGALDFLKDTTVNFTFDGYYAYNFNRPVGRINLLRAYDVSSNSFSINQATVIFERAADPSKGRRFGARVDLQYGQATETVQGNAANEPRPQAYRPILQAYGTYVAPLLKGLTIDFGKFTSAMGYEGNYTKDQFNYSRAYFFNFLPYYHMGFRNTLAVNDKLSIGYWLINGVQQTEDFNGFKSHVVQVVAKPSSKLQWNVIYHVGREQRDLVPLLNPGFSSLPTQPGLSTTPIVPTPDGRFHLLDSFVTISATPKLTLVFEGDYVINRAFEHSAPAHVSGGAAYAHYQATSKTALTGRFEYLSDRGGLFSGVTQALKEATFTYEYKIADGLLTRMEWRRDFSNQPFFLTELPGVLKKEQNTATLGLVWWWGRKQGSW